MISDRPDALTETQKADAWLTPGRFALLLAVLIGACFPEVVSGFETFFHRDFGGFTYPLAFYQREAFWRGELPLWNPQNSCGIPFLAQWNTLTLYPGSLFYLLFPLSWSLGMFCLLHLLWGGMGAWFLAQRWTGNRLAAAIAGVTFAFNGLTWHCLIWTNYTASLAWMPWVVLTVELAWREGGRRIILAALVGALQMLAGGPEIIILTWGCLGVLWLAQFVAGETPRAKMLVRFLCVPPLVAALAAAQLLPFLDLVAHSHRDTTFGDSQWAMPGTGWANYLVPLFHMLPAAHGVFLQRDQYCFSSYYMGVGTITLVVLAIWRVRSRQVWVLAILAAGGVILAMGENGFVYGWLKRVVPQIGFMRYPVKFVILTTFVTPLLAACAVAWLQALPQEKWKSERNNLVRIGCFLLGLIGLVAALAWKYPKEYDAVPQTLANALSRGVFLCAILGCLWGMRRAMAPKMQRLLHVCTILLFWFDVFTHAPRLSPTVTPNVYEPDLIRTNLQWQGQLQPGISRAMETPESVLKMQFGSVDTPVNDVLGRRVCMFADYNLLDHVAKVTGFYALYVREGHEVDVRLYTMTNGLAPLKDFLGVSHTTNPTNAMDWIRRDTSMPLITIGQAPVYANGPSTFQGVVGENFEPQKTVYLPLDARASVNAKSQPEAKVLSRSFSAQHLGAEIETPAATMLVVAQTFYHPWHAYVDGQPVHLLRANYAFQALEVPAGKHQVKLVYEDRVFWVGCGVSLLSLIGCLAAMAIQPKKPIAVTDQFA